MATLRAFFLLLVFQFAGTVLKAILHIPLPGPVLGMALLAGWLLFRRRKQPDDALARTADGLLGWLGLLFVPAGVGVVANLGLLRKAWLPIGVGLLGSTAMTVVVTAWVMSALQRRGADRVAA